MSLPPLYIEGLAQRALLGEDRLNQYKLGLIEAILKKALDTDSGEPRDRETLRDQVRTALEVARWEAPRRGPAR